MLIGKKDNNITSYEATVVGCQHHINCPWSDTADMPVLNHVMAWDVARLLRCVWWC
jgi:hypothetical protein